MFEIEIERNDNYLYSSEGEVDDGPQNWLNWCRLCAKHDRNSMIDIFMNDKTDGKLHHIMDINVAAAIQKYFCVIIKNNEELPRTICAECYSQINSHVHYVKRIAKVQKMFSIFQKSQDTSKLAVIDIDSFLLNCSPLDGEMLTLELSKKEKSTHVNGFSDPHDKLECEIFKLDTIEKEEIDNDVNKNYDDDDDITIDEPYDIIESDNASEYIDYNEIDIDDIGSSNLAEDIEKSNSNQTFPQDSEVDNEDYVNKCDDSQYSIEVDDSLSQGEFSQDDRKKNYFTCTECPSRFRQERHFRYHMRVKHDKVIDKHEYRCIDCNRTFRTRRLLKSHSDVHVPIELKKVIPCLYCDKKFTSKAIVARHIRLTHTDERPFICEECGVAMRTNAALKDHMLTHTSYAPFKCDVCGKCFKSKHRLRMHVEIHNPNKHTCPECGKQLNSIGTMSRHRLIHSNKMPHKCEVCGRAFKSSSSLKVHLILHTGLHPFSCHFCERTFSSNSNCRGHMRKVHPEELAMYDAIGNRRKTHTDVPKFEALKKLTKRTENLIPVISKRKSFDETQNNSLRIEQQLNMFECQICAKNLTTQHRLNNHMKWHEQQEYEDEET